MIGAALLLAQAVPFPPADWSTLPDLPLPPVNANLDLSAYVRREVAAKRCQAVAVNGRTLQVAAPVAVLLDEKGSLQRIVPQAIGCPTVEQYTVGYVSTLVRRRMTGARALKPGWYRHTVTFRWTM